MPKIKLPTSVNSKISKIVEPWKNSVVLSFHQSFPRLKGRTQWDIESAIDKFDRARDGIFNAVSKTENEFLKREKYYQIAKREFDEVFKKFSEFASPDLAEIVEHEVAATAKADALVLEEILKDLAKAPLSPEEKEVDKILSQDGMKTEIKKMKEMSQPSSVLEDNLPSSQERREIKPK